MFFLQDAESVDSILISRTAVLESMRLPVSPRQLGWPLHLEETLPPRTSNKKLQGQKVLSLRDTLCWSTCERKRWRHCKNSALCATSYRRTYKNQIIFLVHEWCVSYETSLVKLRLLHPFSTSKSKSKSGTRKDYLSRLRSPTKSTFKCLFKDTLLWHVVMSTNLRNPNKGYVEEPAAKDSVARKAHIITLSEVWGTEAVIGQATINLYSWVWKSLKDSLPELYCIT